MFVIGDNLFTAIAVSKICNMVSSHHRMIVVKASQENSGPPVFRYHLLEKDSNQAMLYDSTGLFVWWAVWSCVGVTFVWGDNISLYGDSITMYGDSINMYAWW